MLRMLSDLDFRNGFGIIRELVKSGEIFHNGILWEVGIILLWPLVHDGFLHGYILPRS